MSRTASRARIGVFLTAVAAICACTPGCARPRLPLSDYGIPPCAPSAATDYLSVSALQCWFDAPHGRWRIVEHRSLYQELVVEVEAFSLRDADDIAERVIVDQRDSFGEILVYIHPESITRVSRVRRVRWTRALGAMAIEFDGASLP